MVLAMTVLAVLSPGKFFGTILRPSHSITSDEQASNIDWHADVYHEGPLLVRQRRQQLEEEKRAAVEFGQSSDSDNQDVMVESHKNPIRDQESLG